MIRSVLQAPVRRGQLSFVDLAGSERASRTGNMGARLKCVLMSVLSRLKILRLHSLHDALTLHRFQARHRKCIQAAIVLEPMHTRKHNRHGNALRSCRESVAINTSLMTLGRCLEALRWNQTHQDAEPRLVPYRESKITHLFRDALHGWGQILLSVNVSPVACDYDETSHVLKVPSFLGDRSTCEP